MRPVRRHKLAHDGRHGGRGGMRDRGGRSRSRPQQRATAAAHPDESIAYYRALVDHATDLVAVLDREGVYRYAGPSHRRILGHDPDDMPGTDVFALIHPDDQARVRQRFADGDRDPGRPLAVEFAARHADGSWRVVDATITNCLADPVVGGIVLYGHDVTTYRQIQNEYARLLAREQEERQAAEEAQAAAEAAIKVRDMFLYTVSHDLKNPLMTIKLRAQVLQRHAEAQGTPESMRLARELANVDAAATRMGRMIETLLETARMQAGYPLTLHRAATDLVALARRVAAEQRAATHLHQIRVEAPDEGVAGAWDASRIERALDNLLANAVKYSPAGGEIVVRVSRRDEWATVVVEDHGMGIAAADLPHVFNWFYRGRNVGKSSGTGLGLAGARQLIEQHGGTIAVDSVEGAGTTVTVRLPMAPPP